MSQRRCSLAGPRSLLRGPSRRPQTGDHLDDAAVACDGLRLRHNLPHGELTAEINACTSLPRHAAEATAPKSYEPSITRLHHTHDQQRSRSGARHKRSADGRRSATHRVETLRAAEVTILLPQRARRATTRPRAPHAIADAAPGISAAFAALLCFATIPGVGAQTTYGLGEPLPDELPTPLAQTDTPAPRPGSCGLMLGPVQPDAKWSFFASVLARALPQLSAPPPVSGAIFRTVPRSPLARSSQPGTLTAAHRPCQTPSRH